jgi:hypothetical protein
MWLFLLGLLPLAAAAQSPIVIARNCALNSSEAPAVIARNGAFDHSEAIFDPDGRGGEGGQGGGPQAQSKIASPDARASHPPRDDRGELTAAMRAVLLANRPKGMAEAEWLKLMEIPANRTLFPLRVTQGMLDTLDARELDLRFSYVLVNNSSQLH